MTHVEAMSPPNTRTLYPIKTMDDVLIGDELKGYQGFVVSNVDDVPVRTRIGQFQKQADSPQNLLFSSTSVPEPRKRGENGGDI